MENTPPIPSPETPSKKGRSRLGWVLRGVGVVVIVLLLLVATLAVFLQTEPGRARVQAIALSQVQKMLAEDASVSLERLDGNFLTGAQILGLQVEKAHRPVIEIDTVQIRYSLLPLLRRTFSSRHVDVSGLRVSARQYEDGTFDIAKLLKDDDQPPEDEGKPFTVRIGSLELSRGSISLVYWPPDADSTLHIDDLTLDASQFYSRADSINAVIERLAFDATAPHDAASLNVVTAGALSSSRFSLSNLEVASRAGTRLNGDATITFEEGRLPALEGHIAATPLTLDDIRAFTGVPLQGTPDITLTSASSRGTSSFEFQATEESARVDLDGSFGKNEEDGTLTYVLNGTLAQFNPSEWIIGEPLDAQLNGRLSANLTGDSLQALAGPFSFTLAESRVGRQEIDAFDLSGNFVDGETTFNLSSALPGARLTTRGTFSLFEDVPSWRVDGRMEELDLARLTGNPSRNITLAGDFSLDGQGLSLETLSGEAGLRIDRARYNEIQLANGRIDAQFRNGETDFSTEAHFPDGGTLQASGQAAFSEDPITYSITDGRLEHLDLETITGDSTNASDLTGRFSLNGQGVNPEALTAAGEIHLSGSRYSTFEINDLFADYRFQNGRLAFDMNADLAEAGQLTAQGTTEPFADPITLDLEGRAQNLNLAELTGNDSQTSDFSGRYTARLRGIDPQHLSLDAQLELDRSSYGAQSVDGGIVDLSLHGGDLALTGDLQTPEGLLAVDVSGRPFDDTSSLSLGDRTCFSGLDLRRLTGNPDLETDLNGCLKGHVSGLDLTTATIDATLLLQPSRLVDAEISGGEATIDLADGLLNIRAAIGLAGVGLVASDVLFHLSGRPFDDEPHVTGTLQTHHLNLADFSALLPGTTLPESDISLTLDSLALRGTDPETMTLNAKLIANGSQFGDVRIDTLQSALHLEDGVLTVESSRLFSNLADATGGGYIALFDSTAATDYSLEGRLHDVTLVSTFLEAPNVSADRGEFSLRMQGVPGHPFALEGSLTADNVVYGDSAEFVAQQITSEITGEITPNLKEVSIRGQTRFQDFRVPNVALPLQQGDILLAYNNETGFTVEVGGRLDNERKVSVAAAVNTSEAGTIVELRAVNITLGSEDWYLVREAEIQLGEVIRIKNLLLRTGDNSQQIAADGRLDFDGEQRLIVTAENVDMQPLTDLIPPRGTFRMTGLGGTFWGTIFLHGTAENPELLSFLSVEELTSEGESFGSLRSQIDYENELLTVDATLTHNSGRTLTMDGHLPQRFSLAGGEVERREGDVPGNVDLVIHADDFPVAWARPFLNPEEYSDVDGLLSTDSLTITGTYDDLNLRGNLSLTGGRLGITTTGVTFEPLEARLRFTDNRIVLDDVHITDPRTGVKQLDVRGDITLENLDLGRLDLTLQPAKLLAMNNRSYSGVVISQGSSPLHLTGTLDAPELTGAVTLDEADIQLTEALSETDYESIQLSPAEIREVESMFGRLVTSGDTSTVSFMDALDYNLDVEIDRNVWIRSRGGMPFDVEIVGNIDARKPRFAENTVLFGTIDLVRGTVQMPGVPGKRFALEEGAITLNGDPLAALMDLSAILETRLKRGEGQAPITITMGMTGQFNENPEIRLTSNPVLAPADIISVVATGHLSQDIGIGAGGEFVGGLFAGTLAGMVEGAASQALGLDVVQLDVEGNGTVVINLGKYLTDRVFTSVGYRLGNSEYNVLQNQSGVVVGFDYELLRWLMLQAEQGGRRGTGAGLGVETNW